MTLVSGFLVGCSSSRTVGKEKRLAPGNHVSKTVMDSDFLIPEGATMMVDYSSRTRYFVEKGGALTGFPKGVELTTVYAEEGALVPNLCGQQGFAVRIVNDATFVYRNRHRELPPAGIDHASNGGGANVVPVVGVSTGFWGWGRGWGWVHSRPCSGRPVSVPPVILSNESLNEKQR